MGFKRDLTWFIKFLHTYNDNILFDMVTYQRRAKLEVDASLEGLGALWGIKLMH